MSASLGPDSGSESDRLEVAADAAIATCDGDLRMTVKSLILANEFLEHELVVQVSAGFVRGFKHGRFKSYTG